MDEDEGGDGRNGTASTLLDLSTRTESGGMLPIFLGPWYILKSHILVHISSLVSFRRLRFKRDFKVRFSAEADVAAHLVANQDSLA